MDCPPSSRKFCLRHFRDLSFSPSPSLDPPPSLRPGWTFPGAQRPLLVSSPLPTVFLGLGDEKKLNAWFSRAYCAFYTFRRRAHPTGLPPTRWNPLSPSTGLTRGTLFALWCRIPFLLLSFFFLSPTAAPFYCRAMRFCTFPSDPRPFFGGQLFEDETFFFQGPFKTDFPGVP